MATLNQVRRSRFQRGSGCYVCRLCGHNTRDTGGDGAGVQSCDLCYELAGEENSISDTGTTYGSKEGVTAELAALDARNGVGTARRCFPEVCDAVGYGKAEQAPTVVVDYRKCREDGFTITESIRTAVSMNPELTKAQAVQYLVAAGLHATTVRIQFANSRRLSATLV